MGGSRVRDRAVRVSGVAVCGGGHHCGLRTARGAVVGPRHTVALAETGEWFDALSTFRISLLRNGADVEHGTGANVLDGPLSALRHLVGLVMDDPSSPKLSAGEIVSTGTLTRAMPIAPGERWSTKLSGIQLSGMSVTRL